MINSIDVKFFLEFQIICYIKFRSHISSLPVNLLKHLTSELQVVLENCLRSFHQGRIVSLAEIKLEWIVDFLVFSLVLFIALSLRYFCQTLRKVKCRLRT